MAGFFRILLGGAVGAVLGILFVRKQTSPRPGERAELPPAGVGQAPSAAPAAQAPPAAPPTPPAPTYMAPYPPTSGPVYYVTPAPGYAPGQTPAVPTPVYFAPAPAQAPPVQYAAPAPPVAPAAPVYAAPSAAPALQAPAPSPAPSVFQAPAPVIETPAPPVVEPIEAAAPVVDSTPVAPVIETPVAPPAAQVPIYVAPVAPWAPAIVEPEPAAEATEVPVEEEEPVAEIAEPPAPIVEMPPAEAEPVAEETPAAIEEPVAAVEETLPVAAEEPLVAAVEEAPPAAAEEPLAAVVEMPPAEVEPPAAMIEETPAAVEEPDIEEDVFGGFSESGDGSEPEVVFTPQVLEEPVPGSGWEPSAVSPRSDAELEELLPVMPDTVLPYEGMLIGGDRELPEDDSWSTTGWPEIGETAAADSVVSMPVDDWAADWPTAAPPKAEPVTERPEPFFESEERMFTRPVESPATPRGTEERRADPRSVPGSGAAEAAVGEDLKSRIEETRRRIREELEKPFAAVDDEPAAPEPAPAPAPVIGEAMRATPAPPRVVAPAQPETVSTAIGGNGSDYDAMRARIELTRSRLKAKAFDAMMAGEAALLGRESDDSVGTAKPVASFDTEIEQTVDTTLREEDR